MRKTISVFTLMGILLISGVAIQAAATPNENANEKAKNQVASIPQNAIEIEPNLYFLGFTTDSEGKTIGGLLYVYTQKEFAKPPWAGGGKDKESSSSCFEPITKGQIWKTSADYALVPYITNGDINAANTESIIKSAMDDWENQIDPTDNNFNDNIFDADLGEVLVGENGLTWERDGRSEIFFAPISNQGVIGGVAIWGVWWGPPSQRVIDEFDLVLDDDGDFFWTVVDPSTPKDEIPNGVMDLENIVKHELGHAAGLGHPEDTCTEETMFRYAASGETKKRSLEAGDIAGINDLY